MYNMCNYLQKCENDVRLKFEAKFFISSFFGHFGHFLRFFHLSICIQCHILTESKQIYAHAMSALKVISYFLTA